MTIESDLYTELTGNAPLAAVVSTGIYPNYIPQNVDNPVIRYSIIEGDPMIGLSGNDSTLRNYEIQFDIWTDLEQYKQGKEIAALLHAAITGASTFTAVRLTQRDEFDSDNRENRIILTYSVWQ